MYIPNFYKNENTNEIRHFIAANSFGILVSQTDTKLWATHIPLMLDKNQAGKDVLHGHISKGNPQWKNFAHNTQVLAIFSGAHSYISSSWYNHENVPTWNYIAVHIYGTIKIIEGEYLLQTLKKLVDKYETASEHPVSVDTMSPKFLNKELRGIVGFEIEIDSIEAAYKLSQNRDELNHAHIIAQLQQKGDIQSLNIAHEMMKHKK
ncbi:MAG: FMN-binding negative transcriptional regulator [Chitinophagales bacterium]|nr:FMN-binding negative transcriptional regulator [Chitinophagales bacterium]